WGEVGDDHDVWTLLALGPFPRRLRLWTNAVKLSAPALGAAIGVGAHQIRHWASGRTLPSAEHRIALAEAMHVHPAWLAAARDHSGDSDLYLYPRCPCQTGAAFTRDVVATAQAELSVRWCRGCGQPSMSAGYGGLLPLPLIGLTDPPSAGPDEPFAFHAVHTKSGSDLSAPWPHGLWSPGPDSRQRGPVRVPGLLTRPPLTPPQPAPPPPPPVVRARRAPRRGGRAPDAEVARSSLEKIQAFLQWIGDGQPLTVTGQLRLADARMLVEALPTGDVWDPIEFEYQTRTRSSAELPHLQRIVSWTLRSGLLTVDGDHLVPAPGIDRRRFEALPDL
ncbi:helix-turn-helix domain-containing protein, partial [Streptomyces sp. NPDC056937]|uniref:helix-turn-helix domain-containing protein n=2 Tax=unclassified Streptomyces TaxID=2593676 RepID=UPI0036344602